MVIFSIYEQLAGAGPNKFMRCELGNGWFDYEFKSPFLGDAHVTEIHSSWDNKKDWCSVGDLTLEGEYAICTTQNSYFIKRKLSYPAASDGKPFKLIPLNGTATPTNYSIEIISGSKCSKKSSCVVDEEIIEELGNVRYSTNGVFASPTKILELFEKEDLLWPLEINETLVQKLDFGKRRWLWSELTVALKGVDGKLTVKSYPLGSFSEKQGVFETCLLD